MTDRRIWARSFGFDIIEEPLMPKNQFALVPPRRPGETDAELVKRCIFVKISEQP